MSMDWDKALSDLQTGVVRVLFEKKSNGNLREMYCTRNPELIRRYEGDFDEDYLGESDRKQKVSQKKTKTLKVYDLAIEAFRTVPVENVVEAFPESYEDHNGVLSEAMVPGWIAFDAVDDMWERLMDEKDKEVNIVRYVNYEV